MNKMKICNKGFFINNIIINAVRILVIIYLSCSIRFDFMVKIIIARTELIS